MGGTNSNQEEKDRLFTGIYLFCRYGICAVWKWNRPHAGIRSRQLEVYACLSVSGRPVVRRGLHAGKLLTGSFTGIQSNYSYFQQRPEFFNRLLSLLCYRLDPLAALCISDLSNQSDEFIRIQK